MWLVEAPDVSDVGVQLDKALTRADGRADYELSVVEREAILHLYQRYDELGGEPDGTLMPEGIEMCSRALLAAYGQIQKGGRLARLRGHLLSAVQECPLCGFEAATTLDHYLPKELYQALAIYPRNLVPTCQPCNRAKGTLHPMPGQGMTHPYFHSLPAVTFLIANVEYSEGSLSVIFSINRDLLPQAMADRLEFQVQRLSLNQRYVSPINIFLFSLKPSLKMLRGMVGESDRIREFLLASSEDYDMDFRLNHWRTALLRGLASSEAFLADPWAYFDRPLHASVDAVA